METLKTTTNIPTELDADVFARLFIYAKMALVKKAIDALFDDYMNLTPAEANSLLEDISSGDLLTLLSIQGSGKLIESLSQSERITSLYMEMIHESREGQNSIDIEEKCRSLYNASSDAELLEQRSFMIPDAYPFNTEICPHNTRFPWIEPDSWNKK